MARKKGSTLSEEHKAKIAESTKQSMLKYWDEKTKKKAAQKERLRQS